MKSQHGIKFLIPNFDEEKTTFSLFCHCNSNCGAPGIDTARSPTGTQEAPPLKQCTICTGQWVQPKPRKDFKRLVSGMLRHREGTKQLLLGH